MTAHPRLLPLALVVVVALGGVAAALLSPIEPPRSAAEIPMAPALDPAGPEDTSPVITSAPGTTPPGMVWIPGGTFRMGNPTSATDGKPDEAPVHTVTLDGFWMDETEVTNAQYAAFVEATGHVTTAEKPPTLDSVRDSPRFAEAKILPEFNHPGSICYQEPPAELDPTKDAYNWWQYKVGANWRHPEGPESTIDTRLEHPVVHLSWSDCVAYANWAGKELPTEAQWEYAARAGREGDDFPWGKDRNPDGKWLCNIWQGDFPYTNTGGDGFRTTAPVKTFPPNAFGLYDLSGNVWEWCADWYRPDTYELAARRGQAVRNPEGPGDSFDPNEPDLPKKVQRGGSFMCSETYCTGYRVSARMKGDLDSGAFHTGFRCVKRAKP
jgi:formylglycine-generating enzyme